MPRRQPPLPIVTTSGQSVTQQQFGYEPSRQRPPAERPGQSVTQQQFGYEPSRQRPPAERPGQLGGKTVTVKAVCRSDIQGQKATAGVYNVDVFVCIFNYLSYARHVAISYNTHWFCIAYFRCL